MSLKRLTAYVIVAELLGLGVFFAFFLGATASVGGVAYVDMTQFGERMIEYLLMLGLTAVAPYALYVIDQTERGDD
jgi:hypothetical protein